jgi:hypothetical protein
MIIALSKAGDRSKPAGTMGKPKKKRKKKKKKREKQKQTCARCVVDCV